MEIKFISDSGTTVDFPQDSSFLFSNCDKAKIDLPDAGINTSKVTTMSHMFYKAMLVNPNTSNWNTENVTNLSGMFQIAKAANPDVSAWKTKQLTDLSDMFNGATVATPDVAKWDTSQVTNMEGVFTAASAAKPDVSKWKTNKVTNMHNMFAGAGDHGSQYVSIVYNDRLTDAGITASTGSVGDSYDNALAENVNGSYKNELINNHR